MSEWEERKIKDCVVVGNSKVGKVKKSEFLSEGKYPIVDQSQSYISGYQNYSEFVYSGEIPVVIYGDHTNIVKHIDFQFIQGADGIKVLIPKQDFDSKYLFYALNYFKPESKGYRRHFSILKKIEIPFPKSIKEQRRIVKKLDALFAEIDTSLALIDKNIEQAEALKLSVLDEEFGRIEANKMPITEVAKFRPKKSEVRDLSNLDCSFVPMKVLNEKRIGFVPEETRKIEKVYKGYTYFKDGDVLLAKVTPCFQNRKAGVAKNLINGIGFGSSEFLVFRPLQGLLPEYLYYFFMKTDFINNGVINMTGAVGLKRVPKRYIESVEIPFPDKQEQENLIEKIGKVYSETDSLITQYKSKRQQLEALKSSLLDQAFKGEL